jgi:hypothetical protein
MFLAEERAQYLGKSENHLAMGQHEQEVLVHVLPEQQGAFL